MTIQTAAGRSGFAHELVLHTTTAEMLEFVVAFAQDSVAAEEPTLLAVRPETAAAVLDTVGPAPHLTVLPAIGQPGRPASDLRATDALLAGYTATAPRVRILNQEPTVPAEHWHEWRRLEAVVNLALAHHNAWAVCVYDRLALTDDRVEDLCATHPLLWSSGQHRTNDRYQDPSRFIAKHTRRPTRPGRADHSRGGTDRPVPGRRPRNRQRFTQHSGLPAAESRGPDPRDQRSRGQRHPARPAAHRAAALGATRPDDRHRDRHRHRTDRPLRRPPTRRHPTGERTAGWAYGSAISWWTSPTAATPAATPSA